MLTGTLWVCKAEGCTFNGKVVTPRFKDRCPSCGNSCEGVVATADPSLRAVRALGDSLRAADAEIARLKAAQEVAVDFIRTDKDKADRRAPSTLSLGWIVRRDGEPGDELLCSEREALKAQAAEQRDYLGAELDVVEVFAASPGSAPREAAIRDAVFDIQGELQTPLGFYHCMDPKHGLPDASDDYDPVIEKRLTKTLAMLHALCAALGKPMYDPSRNPSVPYPTPLPEA